MEYGVAILGGGFAGLISAQQLKRYAPQLSMLILDKLPDPALAVSRKVGESLAEPGPQYLRKVLARKF
jgi:L-2-hydroxyglutarate oxidase LhgO